MGSMWLTENLSDWTRSYFLAIDDTLSNPGVGILGDDNITYGGKEATRHDFTISSDIAQDVYVMAASWDSKMYPKISGCGQGSLFAPPPSTHKYGIQWNVAGKSGRKGVNGGIFLNSYDSPFVMAAGSSGTISMELFGKTGIMKDFSLVAFGSLGPVTITHNQGLTSDHWFTSGV